MPVLMSAIFVLPIIRMSIYENAFLLVLMIKSKNVKKMIKKIVSSSHQVVFLEFDDNDMVNNILVTICLV
jgi:uncharacterized protein YvpB